MTVDSWHRFRDTLDSLLEGFQIISRDWTYLYVNEAAAQHGRRLTADLIGRKMREAYPGIEDTAVFGTLKRCMDEREPDSVETLFQFPDGTARWFEIRVEPVPEGICVHSVDIQRRKEAEAALREQESVATLGQMAAMVAHEVRNPLAGVSGALQVLRGRRPANDPELPIFDEMLKCIQSLNRLIQDLLVFAKPMKVDAMTVSMDEIVRDALLVLENDETLKRHTVTLSVEEPSPLVHADRELLKNVFRNLFLNAAQAMQDPGSIDVRVGGQGSACRVTVSDTGPGIAPAVADRMFEPFVTSKHGGTGLGLSISRRILRLHGGDLELLPTTGQGATFLLTVPLDAGAARPEATVDPRAGSPPSS